MEGLKGFFVKGEVFPPQRMKDRRRGGEEEKGEREGRKNEEGEFKYSQVPFLIFKSYLIIHII